MAAPMDEVLFSSVVGKSCQIVNIKVKSKSILSKGTLIATYKVLKDDDSGDFCSVVEKFKANVFGTVEDVLVKAGDVLSAGVPVLKVSLCTHPTVMKDMCAECGADLRESAGYPGQRLQPAAASIAMVHSIPELQVSEEEAMKLASQDEERLLKNRKLTLVVDLDQTVIHTTMEHVQPNLPGVKHFQLWGIGPHMPWYHTKIRPGCQGFLEKISKYYELHIFTMGARLYAHTIAGFLDPDKKFFSHRILSRDECFDPNSKTANLKSIFPCGDAMVCIIDDRDDVWNFAPNLVQVRPYKYFEGVGDINQPPGLPANTFSPKCAAGGDAKVDRPSDTDTAGVSKETDTQQRTGPQQVEEAKADGDTDTVDVSKETDTQQRTGPQQVEESKGIGELRAEESMKDSAVKDDSSKMEMNTSKVEDEKPMDTDECNSKVAAEEVKDAPADVQDSKPNSNNKDETQMVDKGGEGDDKKEQNIQDRKKEMTDDKKDKMSEDKADKMTDDKQEKTFGDKDKPSGGKQQINIIEKDRDDYFLYLEDILIRIHAAFFRAQDKNSDKTDSKLKADLKVIVPQFRHSVLSGVHIVFSGVFPTNMPPEQSRAWKVALGLGAQVSAKIVPKDKNCGSGPGNATTHLIAAKAGTSKVHTAQRCKKIHIVTADWLWCCWERWERVDERMFLLPGIKPVSQSSSRCSTPPNSDSDASTKRALQKKRKGTPEGKSKQRNKKAKLQSDSGIDVATRSSSEVPGKGSGPNQRPSLSSEYNPLYSFSTEDLESMDKEVEDIFQDSSSGESDTDARSNQESLGSITQMISSSSEESLTGDSPRGWSGKQQKPDNDEDKEKGNESEDSTSSPGVSEESGSSGDEDKMAEAIDDLLTYSKIPTVSERLNLQRQ